MSMAIVGTVVHVFPTQQVKDTFRKRDFIVRIDETSQYPQEIKIQVTQDRCSSLDTVPVGAVVEVSFNLRGKSYTNKAGAKDWFTSIEAWRIQVRQTPSAQGGLGFGPTTPIQPVQATPHQGDFDDVPF